MFGLDVGSTLTAGSLIIAVLAFLWAIFSGSHGNRSGGALRDSEDRAARLEAENEDMLHDKIAQLETALARVRAQLRTCRALNRQLKQQLKAAAAG